MTDAIQGVTDNVLQIYSVCVCVEMLLELYFFRYRVVKSKLCSVLIEIQGWSVNFDLFQLEKTQRKRYDSTFVMELHVYFSSGSKS